MLFLVYILLLRSNSLIRNFDFHSINVAGAARIAKVAADHGIDNFIHVSHLNAAEHSPSKFYATKFEGELAVKEAFPDATIVRPAIMFGYEDRLLTNMASEYIMLAVDRVSDILASVANMVEIESWPDEDPPCACKILAVKSRFVR